MPGREQSKVIVVRTQCKVGVREYPSLWPGYHPKERLEFILLGTSQCSSEHSSVSYERYTSYLNDSADFLLASMQLGPAILPIC